MIRVIQNIITAGDAGVRRPGEYDLPEAEAAQLVAGGWASYLDEPPTVETPVKETTVKKNAKARKTVKE